MGNEYSCVQIARGRLEGSHEDKKAFPVVRSDDDGMLSEPHFFEACLCSENLLWN